MIISYSISGALVTIEFDALIRSDPRSLTTITEYNVERGSKVADHARPELDRLTIDVMVSNTPLAPPKTNTDGVTGGFRPVEITFETMPPNIPRIIQGVGLITSFLPHGTETKKVEVLSFDGSMDRMTSVYNELLVLQKSTTPINVTTLIREYVNLVIESLSAPRGPSDGESVTFSIGLKEIRFVDSKTTTVKADALKKKSQGVKPGTKTDPKKLQSMAAAVKDKVADTVPKVP